MRDSERPDISSELGDCKCESMSLLGQRNATAMMAEVVPERRPTEGEFQPPRYHLNSLLLAVRLLQRTLRQSCQVVVMVSVELSITTL